MLRNLQRELRSDADSGGQGVLDFSADGHAAAEAAMVRARAVLDLAASLDTQLEATGGAALLSQIELPLVDVLARMEQVGIAADVEAMTALEAQFAAAVREAQDDAYDAIGGEQINLGSPKQLQVVLFDDARHAQDQAHQDRLHHRRRRAAPTSTPRPSTRSSRRCCGTATRPGCGSPSRAC